MYMYMYMYICIYVYMYICIYVYDCRCICVCVCDRPPETAQYGAMVPEMKEDHSLRPRSDPEGPSTKHRSIFCTLMCQLIPSGYVKIAIENDHRIHRNGGFNHL